MKITLQIVTALLGCSLLVSFTGMMTPSVRGHVLNACNEEPVVGAEILIQIEAGLVNPADWQPRVISETTVMTNDEGFYKKPFSIEGPKGLFFLDRYPSIYVKKNGYADSMLMKQRLNGEQYTSYLVPEELHSYEQMQWLWGTRMGFVPRGVNVNEISETFKDFLRKAHAFTLASQTVETDKDMVFLDLFCLRVRQAYGDFSDSDHASMRDYLKALQSHREAQNLDRLAIDACISPNVLSDPPVYTLSDRQMTHVFKQPECGDISRVLTPSSGRDGSEQPSDAHNKSFQRMFDSDFLSLPLQSAAVKHR